MDVPFHPLVVHTPIALIVVSFMFDLVGRATDITWWRKAAMAMLFVGAVGASVAVWTGSRSEEAAEDQGVPEEVIEAHEAAGIFTLWMGWIAFVARVLEARPGPMRGAVSIVALVAHLLAVGGVSLAGFRGGILVYEHGAGVKTSVPAAPSGGEHEEGDED